MGGGAAMRSAAKLAGIGVANCGLRNVTAEHPISAAARRAATRPVSATIVSDDVKSAVSVASGSNGKIDQSVQRPCWELDDWEFAGAEEELLVKSSEPLPRLVFGGAPSLEEAKEATTELNDALEKVYLSSPDSNVSGGSNVASQDSCLQLISNSGVLNPKLCVASENPSVPNNAIRAFRFLHESSDAQTVVASIASDPNVWTAVLENKMLVDFLQAHKISVHPSVKESAAEADSLNKQSPKSFDESSDLKEPGSGNGLMDILQSIRLTVVDMMSNLCDYFQGFFSGSAAEKSSTNADGSVSLVDSVLGASFIGLAVMVIMVVVLKRA